MNTNEIIIDDLKYQTYDNFNWLYKRIKDFSKQLGGVGFPEKLQGQNTIDVPFFKVSDINDDEIYTKNPKNFVSNKTIINEKWKTIPKNTLIFAKVGEALKKNHRKLLNINAMVDNNIGGLLFNKNIISLYGYYLFKTIDMDWFVNIGTVPSINMRNMKFYNALIPSKKEQLSIVKFLDKKIDTIDKKISILERRNTLINELEQSIINQCVTKGVDSFTKLDFNGNLIDFDNKLNRTKEEFDLYMNENGYKNSEIEWLGYIPNHYEIKRMKDNINLFHGYPFKENDLDLDDVSNKKLIKITQIQNDLILLENSHNIKENPIFEKYRINKNDLLIALSGATSGKIGLFNLDEKCYLNQRVAKIISSKYLFKYLFYFFKLDKLTNEMFMVSNISAQPNFTNKILFINNLLLSKKEQLLIVKFLDNKTKQFKLQKDKINKEIELLEEYKKTLINDVVTGKIKVTKN